MKTISREALYRRIWDTPISHVAREFGLSDRGLAKICLRYEIPVPQRGYWAKRQAGHPVREIPLPGASRPFIETVHLPATAQRPAELEALLAHQQAGREAYGLSGEELVIPAVALHACLKEAARRIARQKTAFVAAGQLRGDKVCSVAVSQAEAPRLVAVLDRVARIGDWKIADLKIEQILMKGSQLINRHGADNVSLEDVAGALGATRGTVYHYFSDRGELVRKCLERSYEIYDAFVDYALAHGRTGLEKAAIVSHLNAQAMVGSLQPVAGWMGLEALSPDAQTYARKRLREVLARTERIAEEGIADGSRREQDYRAVNVARAGAYLWIPKWISDIDQPTPSGVADEIVDLFNLGLASLEHP